MPSADRLHVKKKSGLGLQAALGAVLIIGALVWGFWRFRSGETVSLRDGGETVTLNSSGELTGMSDVTDPADRDAVKQALAEKRLRAPADLADLQTPAPANSGSPGATIKLSDPVGTNALTPSPTFFWRIVKGWAYTVTVTDLQGAVVAGGESRMGGRWRPDTALPTGQILQWQVTGSPPAGDPVTSPIARFRIVDEPTRLHLVEEKQQHPKNHVLMAVLYARAGLMSEAQVEVAGMTSQNSDSPVLFDWSSSASNPLAPPRKNP